MRKISEIILHCSATLAGKDYKLNDIQEWHKQRGFKECGYHYVIDLDGTIEIGRSLDDFGAHCLGHNKESIGICYIGGVDNKSFKPLDTRTFAQLVSLCTLIINLRQKFGYLPVYGHNQFANKACPCFDCSIFNR